MAKFLCRLQVRPREGVLDPAGQAVTTTLQKLGYQVQGVHQGKFLEIELEADDAAQADARVREMAGRLLVNPVLEDYQAEVVPR